MSNEADKETFFLDISAASGIYESFAKASFFHVRKRQCLLT